jgi:hypothetical protein
MDFDAKIARAKELAAELGELLGGSMRERRAPRCSLCGERTPGKHVPLQAVRGDPMRLEARFGGPR